MRSFGLVALVLSLSACTVATRAPKADELALRRPANRDGVIIEGDLVRLTWLFSPRGSPAPFLVASRVQSPGGRLLYTFTGFLNDYRGGLLVNQVSAQAQLAKARAASAFHQPLLTRLGTKEAWVIQDVVAWGKVSDPKHLVTLELYASDPRLAASRGTLLAPQLLVIGEQGRDGRRTMRKPEELGVVQWQEAYVVLDSVSVGEAGQLTAATFSPWRPAIPKILAGATSRDFQTTGTQMVLAQERIINETLIEWKTKEMPAWLARMTATEFGDAVILAEKGMLELDVRSRVLKDEIDAAARSGGGADPARTEMAQLIDQRKTLLAVVIGAVKQAWSRAAAGH